MWNPWWHMRLAGSLTIIVGGLANSVVCTLVGLMIQYVGMFGSVERMERLLEAILKKEEESDAIRRD